MTSAPERFLLLPGTYNLRDLGGYVGQSGVTRWHAFLRSDSPHRIGQDGMARLREEGVRLVIDLRGAGEVALAPNPFAALSPEGPEDDHVAYRNISLFEDLAPQMHGAGDVLLDLYLQALNQRQDRFALVLETILRAPEGTVLFHCTAGKDRTGLVAALLLSLAGIERETIIADYALTAEAIGPMLADMEKEAVRHGMDPAWLRPFMACVPETIIAALDALTKQHGTAENYLLKAGMTSRDLARLRARLLA